MSGGEALPPTLEAVIGRNITLVYDALDIQAIDRNKLRELMQNGQPTIMDTPEMVVAVFPPEPWFVQIGDRRIRLTLPIEMPLLGDFPLWEYAVKAHALVPAGKSSLIAYGFNYDVGVRFPDQIVSDVLNQKFVGNRERLEAEINGELLIFAPRVIFKSSEIRYDLVFEPLDDHRIKVHLNAHFEAKGIQLPTQDDIKKSYMEQFEYLTAALTNLFQV